MTNALVYHVASGQAFFSGVALIAFAVLLSRRASGLARLAPTFLGLALVAASATPLPWSLYAAGLAACLAWLLVEGREGPRSRRAAKGLRAAVPAIWALGLALELPYHLMPTLPGRLNPTLAIVGDSLAAGMGGEAETWPRLLASRHGLAVVDLSVAGADVRQAMSQGIGVPPGSIVLAEIGGNDVLGATTPEAFDRDLDALLASLGSGGRVVAMFELPLPPTFNRFGEIQRRLARRHGAILIPKRFLIGIMTTPGATVDSVHLSPSGHDLMARSVWSLLGPDFGG